MSKIKPLKLNNVSETLLIPLYGRAVESRRPDGLLKDERAVALVEQIDYDFAHLKLQNHDHVALILRLREFDRLTRVFLSVHPAAVVVHIGCGLDTRFERVDNGRVTWYDLDLPEVIDLRRQLLGETGDRYHLLACSVFDPNWLQAASVHQPGPFLFIAEGVFLYFTEAQMKWLVVEFRDRFPGSELVFDAQTPLMIWLNNLQMAFLHLKARLHWGLKRPQDLESWGEGIELLAKWYYFERPEPRLGAIQWMQHFPPFARGTGIFHYRLGNNNGMAVKDVE